jgi:ribosome recycling factor
VKTLLKEKEVTEDDDRKSDKAVQALTDEFVAKIDELLAAKETDLLEV